MTPPLPPLPEPLPPERLTVPASLDRLVELREFAAVQGRRARLGEARLAALELVVEEAVVNVITHAYPDRPGTVDVACRTDGEEFVVEIADSGLPFDPTTAAGPDTTLPLEERDIGGFGILLIRRSCDALSWRRIAGRNILSCRFTREPSESRGHRP